MKEEKKIDFSRMMSQNSRLWATKFPSGELVALNRFHRAYLNAKTPTKMIAVFLNISYAYTRYVCMDGWMVLDIFYCKVTTSLLFNKNRTSISWYCNWTLNFMAFFFSMKCFFFGFLYKNVIIECVKKNKYSEWEKGKTIVLTKVYLIESIFWALWFLTKYYK